MFSVVRPFRGITHITDAMGVCFTLIEGEERALLFDTGYGLEDVHSFVRSLTDKPVKVILSHGHHDHILGARWFSETWLCREDADEFTVRTGRSQRERVFQQAGDKGIPVPEDFFRAVYSAPQPFLFPDKTGPFESLTEDLGEMEVRIIRVPGHTPGSIVLDIPSLGLLLTGDDWNPCTWMWFPSSLSATEWRQSMLDLIGLLERDHEFSSVLCSHQPMLREGRELKDFLAYMTPEKMRTAPKQDMGSSIHTCQIRKEPEDWILLFDRDKI
jgi:Zn-dependent hydrolases, including glyoxylases